jgi:hypothetical protein
MDILIALTILTPASWLAFQLLRLAVRLWLDARERKFWRDAAARKLPAPWRYAGKREAMSEDERRRNFPHHVVK